MSVMLGLKNAVPLARAIWSTPQLLKVDPSLLGFLSNYMNKFQIRDIDNHLILHSHLPPLNSQSYTRFVKEHLLLRTQGPSHAQIGITNACPQNCAYCYNKNRKGKVMDKATIIKTARDLKQMGIVWLGLTGGEPLLNKDIIEITDSISNDCAVKLFTTGCTLTKDLASDLKHAGIFSVSVSLDHWTEEKHDAGRRYKGAFKEALKAIDIFKSLNMDVGVSAVLSREMIRNNQTEDFLHFLINLDVNEAWLSEVKPSVEALWDEGMVITEENRLKLVKLQDRYNREGKIAVNYLGHFEGKECFGCNAGHKMVYVDAFGDVSPCVFTPMRFGNVQHESVQDIFTEMKQYFPSENGCFINKNYPLLKKYSTGQTVLDKAATVKMMEEVRFGPLSRFYQLYSRPEKSQKIRTFKRLENKPVEAI
jgi:MoaA/NifB/PqqE/SkfB family radical SAM enzyme